MTNQDFVHLHVHSNYSMLDGHPLVSEIVSAAVDAGQSAVAISDHGNLHHVYELQKVAKERGIQPIFAVESYMAPTTTNRFGRERVFYGNTDADGRPEGGGDVSGGGAYTHLTMIAGSTEGLHNLFRFTTRSFSEGYYLKNRGDLDLLSEYSKGVIATTGCPSGEVQTRIRLGQYEKAREYAAQVQEILGKENYFLELMDHNMSHDLERSVMDDLMRLSKELNIPLLATNDAHYARKEDALSHEHLLAMQTGSYMSEKPYSEGGKRFAFDGQGYYLKSRAEMLELFPDRDFPGAVDNTLLVKEMTAGTELVYDPELRPEIDIPDNHSPETYLREQVYIGARERYSNDLSEEITERIETELGVITSKNYANYFLVTQDFVKWAKNRNMLVGPGRGCLSGDSEIPTSTGIKPLRDITPGTTVFDENGQQVVIPNKMEYDCDEPLVRLSISTGSNKMTADHKVLIKNRDSDSFDTEWVRADEVKVGDYLVSPHLEYPLDISHWDMDPNAFPGGSQIQDKTLKADHDLGLLMGLFIANGALLGDENDGAVLIAHDSYKDTSPIPQLVQSVFGNGVQATPYYSRSNDTTQYIIHHWGVYKLFRRLFPNYGPVGQVRHIPLAMMNTPKDFKEGLINGIWGDGDSYLDRSEYVTYSEQLAHDLESLMLSFRVTVRVEESESVLGTTEYKVTSLSSLDDLVIHKHLAYHRVNSVDVVPSEGKVYDFTVPTTNSYATKSFVVHNSAGGSVVAYALRITEMDPIRFGLLFERFLNPERDSPPDIDLDFSVEDRELVIDYVRNKYGNAMVAAIATFTRMGVKTAIKSTAMIFEKPYEMGDALTKKVPEAVNGHEMTFDDIYNPERPRYEEAQEFRNLVETMGAQDVIKAARAVEGRVKTTGVHAAGVIISSKPLIDHIPLMSREKDGLIITQFDYPTCEALGLLKVDFLGLRNLTLIGNAISNIKRTRGVELDFYDIILGEMDDPKTYELLKSGETLGVFQLDSGGMRSLLKRLAPTNIEDISAVLALYRPGPMGMESHTKYADVKNGRAQVESIHPELDGPLGEITGVTHGLAVYQEQVMSIAQKVAGYSLAQADNLRRAMGKKKKEILDAEFIPFADGMRSNGYSDEAIHSLWEVLVPFAEYGFNKAHSMGYALLSYLTAFLKANYPSEYMSALLTSVFDDTEKLSMYLQECRRMGLNILPPTVNKSMSVASPLDPNTVVFGMSGIGGVSHASASLIIEERNKGGEFKDLHDFMNRVPAEVLNKSILEGLTYGGGFDEFGHTRRGILAILPDITKDSRAVKRNEKKGQDSLFSFMDEESAASISTLKVPDIEEFDKSDLLANERKALGLYLTDHPLSHMENALTAHSDYTVLEVLSGVVTPTVGFDNNAERIRIAGIISSLNIKQTRKGADMAILKIEDLTGTVDVLVFERTLHAAMSVIKQDNVVTIRGVVRVRDIGDTPSVIADSVELVDVDDNGNTRFHVRLVDPEQTSHDAKVALGRALREFPGDSPVHVHVRNREGSIEHIELDEKFNVEPSQDLNRAIFTLFGTSSLGKW